MISKGPRIQLCDFFTDSLSPDWTVDTAGGTATSNQLYSTRTRLRLSKNSTQNQVSITGDVSPTTGRFMLDCHVLTQSVGFRFSLLAADDSELAYAELDGLSALSFSTNVAGAQTSFYNPLKCRLQLLVDTSSSTVRCISTDEATAFAPIGPALAYTGVPAKMRLSTAGTTTGDLYVSEALSYDVKTVAVGDSVTFGHTAESVNPWIKDNDYPHLISSALQHDRFWVVNRGVGSDTTTAMLSRFSGDVLALSPKTVVIFAGQAALILGETAIDLIANVGSMVTAALAAGARVVLCESTPNANLDATANSYKHAYNAWVNAQEDFPHVQVAHTHDALAATPGGDATNPVLYTDYVHPNYAGNQVLASVIGPLLGTDPQGVRMSGAGLVGSA